MSEDVTNGTHGPHGYSRYSLGCRCAVCKGAKAAYMRTKRQTAAARRLLAEDPTTFVAKGITHGTYAGYADAACRCALCLTAKAERGRVAW